MRSTATQFAFLSVLVLAGCDSGKKSSAPNAPTSTASEGQTPPALSEPQTSTIDDHKANLYGMGRQMTALGYYITDRAPPLTERDIRRAIIFGVHHIHAANAEPYKMEWRLTGSSSGDGPNDVPVSFLLAKSNNHIDDQFIRATAQEFNKITTLLIPEAVVGSLSDQALVALQSVQASKTDESPFLPPVHSEILKCETKNHSRGQYALRVNMHNRWEGDSVIVVYFIYIPEGRDVDFSKVSGGGFSHK